MIPTQEMTPFPVFSDNGTKVKPDDPKYAAGFQPGDVVPAEWLNWILNRASGAATKLNAGALSMEQEINNVLQAGSVTPDVLQTNQLVTAIVQIIADATLVSEQLPAVGVPTIWMGAKPDWAIDFGNGANTKYLWANYPKLTNDKFKGILTTLSDAGWMTAYDDSGFYVPDLRGVVPVGYGTNGRRTAETLSGGASVGTFSGSQNKYHNHGASGWFSGNNATGYFDITVDASGVARTKNHSGVFSGTNGQNRAIADFTGTANTAGRVNFSMTPSGSVGVSVAYEGGATQASKPATIGCMWIVRFE